MGVAFRRFRAADLRAIVEAGSEVAAPGECGEALVDLPAPVRSTSTTSGDWEPDLPRWHRLHGHDR